MQECPRASSCARPSADLIAPKARLAGSSSTELATPLPRYLRGNPRSHGSPSAREEAFWLLGADAGFRLPGEALGLRKGAGDFQANVLCVYDNWVRNAPDTTKTSNSEAIPTTLRLARALAKVLDRDYATENENFVFAKVLSANAR